MLKLTQGYRAFFYPNRLGLGHGDWSLGKVKKSHALPYPYILDIFKTWSKPTKHWEIGKSTIVETCSFVQIEPVKLAGHDHSHAESTF